METLKIEDLKSEIHAMHKKAAGSVYQCGYNDALVDVIKMLEAKQASSPLDLEVGKHNINGINFEVLTP